MSSSFIRNPKKDAEKLKELEIMGKHPPVLSPED